MNKEKDNKTLPDKLKSFFRMNKGNFKSREDLTLSHNIEKELSSQNPIHCRTKILKELSDGVLNNQWEDCAAEKLWSLISDLFAKDVSKEHRHIALNFLKNLIIGQYSKLSPLIRVKFFTFIKEHNHPDDMGFRLEILKSLTDNGKDLVHLEDTMGYFLLEWMPFITCSDGKQGADFLCLLVNVIKFNSACIDEDVISGLVHRICELCSGSQYTEVVSGSLEALDAIVRYSKLRPDSLLTFIIALCRSVNVEAYCQTSWKIMRNLLGTHMGHSALYKMCYLLQEDSFKDDICLLRGAVFYINMGLWGSSRIQKLECTPSSVLPSFYQALHCNNPIVMYEVILAIQRLVNKYGTELQQPTWSIILDIIEKVIIHTENSLQPATKQVSNTLHETISNIENLLENDSYNGDIQKFYELIERCSDARPEQSIFKLIDYRASLIGPTHNYWQAKLISLMERYFKLEVRTNIRIKILDILSNIININRPRYEDELIERIVVPQLQHLESDLDMKIRDNATKLLVNLCLECESKRCLELLDILEKVINRPLNIETSPKLESDMQDVKTATEGLIRILMKKVYRQPSNHAIRAYKILVNHLEQHYKDTKDVFRNVYIVRYMIFECFLRARANSLYQLGFSDSPTGCPSRYSTYLVLEHNINDKLNVAGSSPPPASPLPIQHFTSQVTQISLAHACKAVATAIKQEKDWKVLQLILKELPFLMQNRALILSRHSNDVGLLAAALCSMIEDKNFRPADPLHNVFYNIPIKFTFSEFRVHFFPVLASLTSYHAYLDFSIQQRLIKCFEDGLKTPCASQCVTSLMTCTLEMRDAMSKLVSNVLLTLSKISDTVTIAIPILEFLSTLTRLPKVYASFTIDQYMSIFAIILPYTKPIKYNHYTVSLAHHVIAVWFLKCRLPFRQNFAKYITKGLKTNVNMLLEEGNVTRMETTMSNEDSSNRKRSSSLTEQGSRARKFVKENKAPDMKLPVDKASMNFHIELTETCIDLMARYSHSMYSARPKRSPAAEFLLKEGQSSTWVLRNKLITVTTSGCSSKATRGPLCDNCWVACKATPPTSENSRSSHSSLWRPPSTDGTKEEKLSRQSSGGHGSSSTNTAANSPTEENKKSIEDLDNIKQKEINLEGPEKSDLNIEALKLEQIITSNKHQEHTPCACWCQGWAEIYIRRPTGDTSWIMRVQNCMQFESSFDLPFHEITSLYMPTDITSKIVSPDLVGSSEEIVDKSSEICQNEIGNNTTVSTTSGSVSSGPIAIPGSNRFSPSRQSSRDSLESLEEGEDDNRKSRNPVRRSNSSPEMSSNWKNPFLNKEKLNFPQNDKDEANNDFESKSDADSKKQHSKNFAKDMRVSCEAIPEEIAGAGTTPPTGGPANPKSNLQTQKSYPGPITVPPSPTAVQPTTNLLNSQARNSIANDNLMARPPQSPTAYSRLSSLDLSHGQHSGIVDYKPPIGRNLLFERREEKLDPSGLPPLSFRDRGHTISVMSPAKIRRGNSRAKDLPVHTNLPNTRNGTNPSFVFLQLYHTAHFGSVNEKPLLVPQSNPLLQTSITNLDRIQPYETHKIGILYVGLRQTTEADILANEFGSLRYAEFLKQLGTLIRLKDADESIFLGGLDRNGENGNFAYIWQDDVTQVAFHVATLMPTKSSDPQSTSKKQHIGNNYVTIVYNESGEPYNIQTVRGQFNYACVIIQPLDHGTNQVTVQAREELSDLIGHSEPKIISDQNLAILSRQLALHANLASMVCSSLNQKDRSPYASNWLERLRHVKRLRKRVLEELSRKDPNNERLKQSLEEEDHLKIADEYIEDFTDYTA